MATIIRTISGEYEFPGLVFGEQAAPTSVAVLPGGGFVVAVAVPTPLSNPSAVLQQRFDAAGVPLGALTQVNTTAGASAGLVTPLAGGGYVISWHQPDYSGDTPNLFFRRYDAAGAPLGGETPVNTTTTGAQWFGGVAALADGGFVAVWTSEGQDGSGWGVYARRYGADGVALGGETLVNTTTAGDQAGASVTGLTTGGYVVTWMSPDGSEQGVYLQRYDAAGVAQGGETLVNTTTDGHQGGGRVVALPDGGFVVHWSSTEIRPEYDPQETHFVSRTFDAAGAPVGGEVIGDLAGGPTLEESLRQALMGPDGGSYKVAPRDDGGYVMAWDPVAFGGVKTAILGPATFDGRLSAAKEIAAGVGSDDVFLAEPGDLAGDIISGGAGYDRIELERAGTLDATAVARMTGIEELRGSGGADTIVVSAVALQRMTAFGTTPRIDGSGGFDTLQAATSLSLEGLTLASIEKVTGHNVQIKVGSFADAILVDGASSYIRVDAAGFELTEAQRAQLFANGVDAVVQPRGLLFKSDGTVLLTRSTQVSSDMSANQFNPDADALSGGGHVVVWEAIEPGSGGFGVYARRFDGSGQALGDDFHVNTTTEAGQAAPSVAGLLGGDFVVTWMSYGQDGAEWGVYARRYDASGAALGGEVRVNSTTALDQIKPRIAGLSDGGYVVTWTSAGQDGSGGGVYAQRYNASGVPQGGETRVNTTTDGDQGNAHVLGLSGGGYVVVWGSSDGSGGGVYSRQYDSSGGASGGETLVNTTTANSQFISSLSALPGGGYVVRWDSWEPFPVAYSQSFDAVGIKQGGETLVDPGGVSPEPPIGAVALVGGGYVVVQTPFALSQTLVLPVDYRVLTTGADAIAGAAINSLFVGAPQALSTGDNLTGGAGYDQLELLSGGTFDLTAPTVLSGFEKLMGSSGNDTFIVSNARLADFTLIDGGLGEDAVRTSEASLNLIGRTLVNVEKVATDSPTGTNFSVDSLFEALLIHGGAGFDTLTATTLKLRGAFDGTIFLRGIDKIVDADGTYFARTLSLAATDAVKAEGNSGATAYTFTVTRPGDKSFPTTAEWAVTGSGANPATAADFQGGVLPSGLVSFAAGETSKTITIQVATDTVVEPDEGFTVTLSNASNAGLATASALGQITNDDATPTLAIAATDAVKAEGDSGATAFTFTVTRSGDVSGDTTADWAVTGSGANAANAADFQGGVLPSGQVSFAVGETSKTVTVNVAADIVFEQNEGFTVTLSNVAGAGVTQASASGQISNDDPETTLAIAAVNGQLAEGDFGSAVFSFTVTRAGPVTGASAANWAVSGAGPNPANAADFAGGVFASGVVSFAAGDVSKTITVSVAGDRASELNEAFAVTLSNATGAGITTASATSIIANDDTAAYAGDEAGNSLIGDVNDNWMDGRGGADSLAGGIGADTLVGGPGDDTLDGGGNVDTADYSAATDQVSVDLAALAPFNTGVMGSDFWISIENVTGGAFADTLAGNGADNLLAGGSGADSLSGGGGKDTLLGGEGDDRLDGGLANDLLDGGPGADTATYAGAPGAVSVNLASGSAAGAQGIDNLAFVENIVGSAFADTLTGDALGNAISGGSGADRLIGGGGADTLAGEAGADTFVYVNAGDSTPLARDLIADFVVGEDRIDLTAIDAVTGGADQAFVLAIGGFAGVAGQLMVSAMATPGHYLVEGDVNGDSVADFAIRVVSGASLQASDFLL
jgi:Ca2+-binding RTX toxin-like protein